MPTDEQIAEFGRQMRKEAKQIVKALKQIQKEAKEQNFTVELGNMAVDVAEGKMKVQEAAKRLKMVIPLRLTNPPCLERRFHSTTVSILSGVVLGRLEGRYVRPYASHMISSKKVGKVHKFYRPMLYPYSEVKAYNRFTEDSLIGVRLHEKT
jgi:hypothetical protein